MSSTRPRVVTCELCGFEFDASGLQCHTGCPMSSKCSLICCPNCGYQEVDATRSVVARTLFRLWPSSQTHPAVARTGRTVPLSHIPRGVSARIDRLDLSPSRLSRLSAFGLVPGTEVVLKQRRPVPVLGIGETELAVSEEILSEIWVETDAPRTK